MRNIDWHLETHELLKDNIQVALGIIGITICVVILYKMFKKEFGGQYTARNI